MRCCILVPCVVFSVQVKTMLEEVDIRMSESKRDTRDFKKDVVVGGENPRTGRTSTEKFTKFALARLLAALEFVQDDANEPLMMCNGKLRRVLQVYGGSYEEQGQHYRET